MKRVDGGWEMACTCGRPECGVVLGVEVFEGQELALVSVKRADWDDPFEFPVSLRELRNAVRSEEGAE